jgi:hypothetical protein
MRSVHKTLTLIILLFLIRLTLSCCRCPELTADFQFNSITIVNLDNSLWEAQPTDQNVMSAAAVAFEISLADSSFIPKPEVAGGWSPGFTTARAMEDCWCPYHFFPEHEITKFSVITLHGFSQDVPAGSDIADSFLWQIRWNHLYRSVDSLLSELNRPFYGDLFPEKTYQLFCSDSVQNDSLQLVFQFHFANGELLSDTTHVISIIESLNR